MGWQRTVAERQDPPLQRTGGLRALCTAFDDGDFGGGEVVEFIDEGDDFGVKALDIGGEFVAAFVEGVGCGGVLLFEVEHLFDHHHQSIMALFVGGVIKIDFAGYKKPRRRLKRQAEIIR
jgi:hypothetical protein